MAAASSLPALCRAAIYRAFGGPEVVQVENVPIRMPQKGEVLIRVKASSVNPADWRLLSGVFATFLPKLPRTLGLDVAGIVEQVGPNVTRFKAGDAVWGSADPRKGVGSMADFAVVAEHRLARKPENISFAEAASLTTVASTAYEGLTKCIGLKQGERLLIIGGAGGVGTATIQMARSIGAHVTVTCSAKNANLVRALGADEVVDYNTQKWWQLSADTPKYDAIYNAVDGTPGVWDQARQALKPKGRYASAVPEATNLTLPRFLMFMPRVFNRKFWHVCGYQKFDLITADPNPTQFEAFNKMIEAGTLRAVIEQVMPLETGPVREAIARSIAGHIAGKIVIAVDPAEMNAPIFKPNPALAGKPAETEKKGEAKEEKQKQG